MSALKRTGTIVNDQFRNAGMSGAQLKADRQEQAFSQINRHKNANDYGRLLTEQENIGDRFVNNIDGIGDINEYKASHAKELFDRRGGKRRRSLRKYKKSKRVFRKKSRATRRR